MSVLVIGGTGTVGSETVRRLLQKGVDVKCMTRSAERLKDLPAGVVGVIGDLEQPESLKPALEGVDSLFLLTPLAHNESEQGVAAVAATRAAGLRKIVYMSVAMPKGSEHIPHFKSKIPIEEAVKSSGLAWTVLRPNNFFQNDLWFKDAVMTYGIYPQPIGSRGMNRVDVRDIADEVVNALTESGHDNEEYGVHGPDALTGEEVARIYSRRLGREVRYGGDDLDAWEQQAKQMMPGWLVKDLRIMYQYFQDNGFEVTKSELAKQRTLLGHEPRSFDAFVAEVITPMWKGVSAG